jgi:hypothetical protein
LQLTFQQNVNLMANMITEMVPEVISQTQLGTCLTSFADEADEKSATSWYPTSHTPFQIGEKAYIHQEAPPAIAGGASLIGQSSFATRYNDAEVCDVPTPVEPPKWRIPAASRLNHVHAMARRHMNCRSQHSRDARPSANRSTRLD